MPDLGYYGYSKTSAAKNTVIASTASAKHGSSVILTPELLLQIGEDARMKFLPNRDAQSGDCQTVSDEIVERLHALGFDDSYRLLD
jgi:hypothetical protein